MKESDIIRKIMEYLKSVPGCFAWKEHGGMYGTSGIPDVICCFNGRFYAFEVKTQDGRTTKLQEVMMRRIREAGGIAAVVRSAGEVAGVLSGQPDAEATAR